jgi:TonB family protein
MSTAPANPTLPDYKLKDDLSRLCLTSARRDPNQKIAWVNSVCILFLIIGIAGARRGIILIKPVPPIHEIVPVVVEPISVPLQMIQNNERPVENNQPRVVVAIPNTPNISFSVPTIGTLIVPAALASAPPLKPLQAPEQISSICNTGVRGERPQPPYPRLAMENGEQGTIVLLLGGDAAGNVVSIDVQESTGFSFLDQTTVTFIKTRWHLPTNLGTHLFQTTIAYKLQF